MTSAGKEPVGLFCGLQTTKVIAGDLDPKDHRPQVGIKKVKGERMLDG